MDEWNGVKIGNVKQWKREKVGRRKEDKWKVKQGMGKKCGGLEKNKAKTNGTAQNTAQRNGVMKCTGKLEVVETYCQHVKIYQVHG